MDSWTEQACGTSGILSQITSYLLIPHLILCYNSACKLGQSLDPRQLWTAIHWQMMADVFPCQMAFSGPQRTRRCFCCFAERSQEAKGQWVLQEFKGNVGQIKAMSFGNFPGGPGTV